MRRAASIAAFALAVPDAFAAPVCSDSAHPFTCRLNERLNEVLNLLDVAAIVLALVLIAALFFVVRMYRKNRRLDPSLHRAERKTKGSR